MRYKRPSHKCTACARSTTRWIRHHPDGTVDARCQRCVDTFKFPQQVKTGDVTKKVSDEARPAPKANSHKEKPETDQGSFF